MINPTELYNKIDEAVEEYSKQTLLFKQLDNGKKSLLAKLTLEQDGKSQAEKETKALATDEYQCYCGALSQAESQYIKAKFKLQNMFTYVENIRTVEVSNRQAVK